MFNPLIEQLISLTMPIELFITLTAIAFICAIVGFLRSPTMPILVFIGGIILVSIAVMTGTLYLGQVVSTSTVSGSTTTYTYTPDNFTFTSTVLMLYAIFGAVLILAGAGLYIDK